MRQVLVVISYVSTPLSLSLFLSFIRSFVRCTCSRVYTTEAVLNGAFSFRRANVVRRCSLSSFVRPPKINVAKKQKGRRGRGNRCESSETRSRWIRGEFLTKNACCSSIRRDIRKTGNSDALGLVWLGCNAGGWRIDKYSSFSRRSAGDEVTSCELFICRFQNVVQHVREMERFISVFIYLFIFYG